MKYFDAFSGYGGFSLGIRQAYENSRMVDTPGQVDSVSGGREAEHRPGMGDTHRERDSVRADEGTPTCIGFSEIDKYATAIYQKHFPYEECEPCRLRRLQSDNSERPEQCDNATDELEQRKHTNNCQCKHKPYGSITDIDASTLPDFDLFVGGFPCQAFSIAGKRGGFEDTRGTLIYDVLRIVKEKHPRLVLLENVKGLLSHDSGRTFKTIITALAELGYAVEWQVLNAKDFGVPQNRERVFIVGHLGGFGGRAVFPLGTGDREDIEAGRLHETDEGRLSQSQNGRKEIKHPGDAYHETGGKDSRYERSPSTAIRRLTPTECERLMGLPDGWTGGVSDTQRYKLCGNGVVVNVVEEIIKRLI